MLRDRAVNVDVDGVVNPSWGGTISRESTIPLDGLIVRFEFFCRFLTSAYLAKITIRPPQCR